MTKRNVSQSYNVVNDARVERVIREIIDQTSLDLSGLSVYTEAATGVYCIGASIAGCARAESVHCMTRDSRFGSAEDAIRQTREFALQIGLNPRSLSFSKGHDTQRLSDADIITNMGMLRPISSHLICKMRAGSVISLMYEPWEFRESDVDIRAACRNLVKVVALNEDHPQLRLHRASPALILRGLFDAGLGVFPNSLLLVCGNLFVRSVVPVLAACCHSLDVLDDGFLTDKVPANCSVIDPSRQNDKHYDAIIVHDVALVDGWNIAAVGDVKWNPKCLGSWEVCIQSMGNIDREKFPAVRFIPEATPPRNYMGLNPATLGVDLVARLVAGGLRAAVETLQDGNGSNDEGESHSSETRWGTTLRGGAIS